uniref:Acyltransferase 3 domain-containing protein n=1 Tax=Parascaris equorum TaxID=6256 RepID=A0A914R6A5_PAREQ
MISCCTLGLMLFIPNNEFLCRLTVTAAATLIVARISPSVNDSLKNETLLFIGDISYSLYLAHWPIIVFFSDKISDCLIVAQLSILLAYLSFKTVEKYFIRKNLLKALMFIALIFGSSTILIIYPNTPLLISPRQRDRSSITTFLSGGDKNETEGKTLFGEKQLLCFPPSRLPTQSGDEFYAAECSSGQRIFCEIFAKS